MFVVQNHMLTHHSRAHLFACNFCGLVFPSLEALKAHDGCEQFATALVQRISSSGEVDVSLLYYMNFATMVMVCTDCGSQLLIRSTYIGDSSIAHWKDIVNFHLLHNAEKMVPLIIFSPADFTVKMRLRIQTIFPAIKGIQVECPYCGKADFDSVDALEEHFLSHDECSKKTCPECSSNFSQEAFYRARIDDKGGVPSCGPNLAAGGGLIYGGVSSAVFTSKLQLPYVDAWESVTVRKKSNRRGRKRRAGPVYRKDPDEVEEDLLFASDTSTKLKKILGDSFDCENVLRVNSFFYTAINSKDETVEESSEPFNSPDAEFESATEHRSETEYKFADDLSRRFTKYCRLAGGKTLTKKHNPSHSGLFSKSVVFQHPLVHCLFLFPGNENDSAPFDLEDGLLVFCVYAGNGVPNTRITCWECSATVCSVFGLRVHMIVDHGMFLKVEDEPSEAPDLIGDNPAFFTSTTRTVNKIIGLTENGCLPVNLEERRKEAQLAKLKSAQNAQANTPAKIRTSSTSSASPLSFLNRTQTPSAASASEALFASPPLVVLDEAPPPSVQFIDYSEPQSVEILYQAHKSPVPAIAGPSGTNNGEQIFVNGTNFVSDNSGLSTIKDVNVHYDSGGSTDNFSQEDLDNAVTPEVIHGDDESKQCLCEFCGLTLRSCVALSAHYKLHSEITSVCYLCDPANFTLGTPEMYLSHIHERHTAPLESGKEVSSCLSFCACASYSVLMFCFGWLYISSNTRH
ncbi:zinc finger, C2H2 type [Oesophagostomum dentatum]|uniref:Zinc finger, C2H2 type n=1 Tax=Oesophagostomum dentatum TaxID=61180 RepID=A0A0B1TGW0_OESDE|nr:zinc finger, C2H2 type [Oesophagostomum dentatum]